MTVIDDKALWENRRGKRVNPKTKSARRLSFAILIVAIVGVTFFAPMIADSFFQFIQN